MKHLKRQALSFCFLVMGYVAHGQQNAAYAQAITYWEQARDKYHACGQYANDGVIQANITYLNRCIQALRTPTTTPMPTDKPSTTLVPCGTGPTSSAATAGGSTSGNGSSGSLALDNARLISEGQSKMMDINNSNDPFVTKIVKDIGVGAGNMAQIGGVSAATANNISTGIGLVGDIIGMFGNDNSFWQEEQAQANAQRSAEEKQAGQEEGARIMADQKRKDEFLEAELSNINTGTGGGDYAGGVIRGKVFYDFNDHGVCEDPTIFFGKAPHSQISYHVKNKNVVSNIHFIDFYKNTMNMEHIVQIAAPANSGDDGLISSYLDECTFTFPLGLKQAQNLALRNNCWQVYGKAVFFTAEEMQALIDFFQSAQPSFELANYVSTLQKEIEKALKDITENPPARLKDIREMTANSVFLNYMIYTTNSAKYEHTLRVIGSDGIEIAKYSKYSRMKTGRDASEVEGPIEVDSVIRGVVADLTQKLMDDNLTMRAINNQGAIMRNRYVNDGERMKTLVRKLPQYVKNGSYVSGVSNTGYTPAPTAVSGNQNKTNQPSQLNPTPQQQITKPASTNQNFWDETPKH